VVGDDHAIDAGGGGRVAEHLDHTARAGVGRIASREGERAGGRELEVEVGHAERPHERRVGGRRQRERLLRRLPVPPRRAGERLGGNRRRRKHPAGHGQVEDVGDRLHVDAVGPFERREQFVGRRGLRPGSGRLELREEHEPHRLRLAGAEGDEVSGEMRGLAVPGRDVVGLVVAGDIVSRDRMAGAAVKRIGGRGEHPVEPLGQERDRFPPRGRLPRVALAAALGMMLECDERPRSRQRRHALRQGRGQEKLHRCVVFKGIERRDHAGPVLDVARAEPGDEHAAGIDAEIPNQATRDVAGPRSLGISRLQEIDEGRQSVEAGAAELVCRLAPCRERVAL